MSTYSARLAQTASWRPSTVASTTGRSVDSDGAKAPDLSGGATVEAAAAARSRAVRIDRSLPPLLRPLMSGRPAAIELLSNAADFIDTRVMPVEKVGTRGGGQTGARARTKTLSTPVQHV